MGDSRQGQAGRGDQGRDEERPPTDERGVAQPFDPATLAEIVSVAADVARRQLRRFPPHVDIEAEAVAHDVLLSLVRAVDKHPQLARNADERRAYITVVVRSRLIDAVRSAARRAQREQPVPPADERGAVADTQAPAAFGWAEWRAELARLSQRLLPSNPALAHTITLLEATEFDLPLATLAGALNVSLSTAARLRAQALAYLRRALAEH